MCEPGKLDLTSASPCHTIPSLRVYLLPTIPLSSYALGLIRGFTYYLSFATYNAPLIIHHSPSTAYRSLFVSHPSAPGAAAMVLVSKSLVLVLGDRATRVQRVNAYTCTCAIMSVCVRIWCVFARPKGTRVGG